MRARPVNAILTSCMYLSLTAAIAAEQPQFNTLNEALVVPKQAIIDAVASGAKDDVEWRAVIREKAKQGDENAQFSYGMLLMNLPAEKGQAENWFRKASEQGFAPAQYMLGASLVAGLAGRTDVVEGRHWLLLSAQHGFATSQNELGTLCYRSGDFKCAMEWYQKASAFEVDAMATLGRMYYFGKGTKIDKFKARELLTRAANENDAPSQYLTAYMNFSGEGGEKNVTKARDYGLAAYKSGYADAPIILTDIYLNGGPGFQTDPVEARKWAVKGAEAGNADSQAELAIFYGNGTGGAKNMEESRRWNIKAAQGGSKNAMFNLGLMLCNGQGGPGDYREAMRWFLKAAQSGMPEAEHNIGAMYQNGWGVPVDFSAARSWYAKAAAQGFGPSRTALANFDRPNRSASGPSHGSVFGTMICSKMLTGRAFSASAWMGPC